MQKFNTLKSIPAYLPIVNIDTDMIIPKQFSLGPYNTIITNSGRAIPIQAYSLKPLSTTARRTNQNELELRPAGAGAHAEGKILDRVKKRNMKDYHETALPEERIAPDGESLLLPGFKNIRGNIT